MDHRCIGLDTDQRRAEPALMDTDMLRIHVCAVVPGLTVRTAAIYNMLKMFVTHDQVDCCRTNCGRGEIALRYELGVAVSRVAVLRRLDSLRRVLWSSSQRRCHLCRGWRRSSRGFCQRHPGLMVLPSRLFGGCANKVIAGRGLANRSVSLPGARAAEPQVCFMPPVWCLGIFLRQPSTSLTFSTFPSGHPDGRLKGEDHRELTRETRHAHKHAEIVNRNMY